MKRKIQRKMKRTTMEEIEMWFMHRLSCHRNQKNALIPTRCRFAPNRSSFNDNRYQSSLITSDRTIEEEKKIESGGDLTQNP
uniref:Uncharacterized protein n=2 Tax=Cucumis melo TaxID=3656 RepID=A0A9I9EJP2_CUCME